MRLTKPERKAQRFQEAETVKAAALFIFLVVGGQPQPPTRRREPQAEVGR